MHKNAETALLELNETTGWIQKIREVYAPMHLPIGVTVRKGVADRAALNTWWTDRTIPAYRIGMRDALEAFGAETPAVLSMRCHGLSLSDAYWIKAERSEMRWEDVNFFRRPFSDDVGDVLFGARKSDHPLDLVSPDNTTDGFLKKRWIVKEGKRYLMKGGSYPFFLQPFYEVVASEIMARLKLPHVPYTLIWSEGKPYSLCEDFLDENTELIPAWRVMMTQKKSNGTSVYQHFVNCCESLGIGNVTAFLDRMITLDYIIANEDRHFNNFGLLRNAETLAWLGMAPIYDSGSCLGYDKSPADIRLEKGIICKPFKNHHTEQLRLVQSFDWLDLSGLDGIEYAIKEILLQDTDGIGMDAERVNAVTRSVRRRIERLESFIRTRRTEVLSHGETSTVDDVEKNVAENYLRK
ncbi:MAG: excisionase [Clostridia bacterium]|nr:excisionase [Clostridia bacterium]